MRPCPFCGRLIDEDAIYCSGCGKEVGTYDDYVCNPITEAMLNYDNIPNSLTRSKYGIVKCPRCEGRHLYPINETETTVHTSGKGYSGTKGCLGWLLFGPIGLLFGNMGEKHKTSVSTSYKLYWVCNECGYKFRNLDNWNIEIEEKCKQKQLNQYSAITMGVLAILFFLIGGGLELVGILFFIIAASNGIRTFALELSIKREKEEYEKLKIESLV